MLTVARFNKFAGQVLIRVLMVTLCAASLIPFVYVFGLSFKGMEEVYRLHPSLLPKNPTLEGYQHVFKGMSGGSTQPGGAVLRFYRNSVVITTAVVLISVFEASLAGYAFARLRFRGRDALFYLFIVMMFLPSGGSMMAMYMLVKYLGLIDTHLGVILCMSGGGGVYLFLMRQIFLNIPSEIEDAAKVDGANDLQIGYKIMFPLATSGMVLIAVMSFLGAWSEVLVPGIIIRTSEKLVIPMMIGWIETLVNGSIQARSVPSPNLRAVVGSVTVVPTLLVFILLQRWFIRGAVEGLKL